MLPVSKGSDDGKLPQVNRRRDSFFQRYLANNSTNLKSDEDSLDATNYNFLVNSQGEPHAATTIANERTTHKNLSALTFDKSKPNPFRARETSVEIEGS